MFLLVRPVEQKRDFMYFGVFHWSTLKHNIADNSLIFVNMKPAKLTGPDAVKIDRWNLIEVHRDEQNRLTCFVNGKNVTLDQPAVDGEFRFCHLMNNNKGVWKAADPFVGDLAAFALYSNNLSPEQQQAVRDYF